MDFRWMAIKVKEIAAEKDAIRVFISSFAELVRSRFLPHT